MPSTRIKIVVVALVVVLVAVVLYSALTFPRAVLDLQVSLSVGVDIQAKEFDMPFLQDEVLVEVAVTTGTALWRASIIDASGSEIWSHSTAQGDSTTYQSGWIALPSGHYNFTFGTIGIGNLDANVKITSKGGFW
jgi:hypothetical protein